MNLRHYLVRGYDESMQFLLGLQLQDLTTTNALDAEALAIDDTREAVNDENYKLDINSSNDRYASNLSRNSSMAGKRRGLDNDSELQDLIGESFSEVTHFRLA
ncbi:PREDICTED: uncharacterized protein LOC108755124 isoform X1 [Trachymyrmex septentrionalis]|uniref:uncharacterized protein LOC108755124 isoform X1 n=1 Tax=Trachymyrmex septentrionalis TaxID=34720 RepID=UPI00084EE924|nr:PREDICTED: uncharacterized protein LOC108755124 isoform X1 [Trachymyrmex septentrionalis]